MTLDENLVMAVDRAAKLTALREVRARGMEKRQRDGYAKVQVREGEFDVWEGEQAGGDR